ncbi:MAG TPA: bifunctional diaminohydroxyphosphoribosylaminopyrimidine deaminase/5-amino-6-(5-phosphoribosylamino)uracil reductase RibD [Xanthomonadaceae bacterium]|nr:bifunctional diaminohydroxyphosphoribosylaminopyrimidine deaminase/5-amino-6-(5-phosphoribosylamino)uracil reductase RibD [Xanthomonadaceae bacterium]
MACALRLAARGQWTARPNPAVGCVIAHGEEVVGEGWHRRAGEAHAEPLALQAAGERARGATAYVTLEPCAHHGRTPPCAEALLAAGIARVVSALHDPFEHVNGRGLARLREGGVQVDTGLLEAAAREINRGFLSRVHRGRPWLRVKLAMSLDGRTALAGGESRWISSAASRRDVARWRARCGALLTTDVTVRADDPMLTVRLDEPAEFAPPLRVVLAADLGIPAGARILDASAPTLLVHAGGAAVPAHLSGCERIALDARGDRVDPAAAVAALAQRGINEVQVEAGATLCGALLEAGLVDELLVYVAPVVLGERARPLLGGLDVGTMAQRRGFSLVQSRRVGPDLRLLYRPEA